ncbi:major facilitator superfamily MFS_1 [Halalkaliarchaeum desulfuricum]|uniref:Major facilitator superfamily MFS_1 n=1 Tax=Halalkaliarchaeum desulfuricum TaxID=2055893 RepID=A0A343TJ83_9EURY|nr:MFS transporter [Halalkaliarchaeum desulfuricum]AUX09155.1 major facilitator superfamily MFS_1 [Halalkaliarchaeum desulfuricum]
MSRVRLFGTLCGLVFLVNFARIIFAPLVGEFMDVFSVREGTIGLVVTLTWVGSASPRLPTGYLLTKVPRHYVVLGAGTVLTAASFFIATAATVPALMAGAFTMGLASGAYFVSANPLISELFPERVGRVIGVHGMASQFAAVLAAPIVSVAVVYDWRLVFYGTGIAAATITLLIFLAARRTDLPDAGTKDRDFFGAARREWRIIVTGVVMLGTVGFVWQGMFNFYEQYMLAKGLPESVARNLLTVLFAAGVPAFLVSGRLADRLPHVPYILGVIAAFLVSVFALTMTSGLFVVIAVSAVLGFVIHSLFPAMDTYLLDTLPDASRASAYAFYSASMMLAQAGGASVVGALVERGFTYDAVFGVFLSGLLVVVIVLAALESAGRLP